MSSPVIYALLVLLVIVNNVVVVILGASNRSFVVDYNRGVFLKDGKPFNYVSGSIHYSRVHPNLWHDRLYKMKYAGLDAIQVYVPWNFHETEQGRFNFAGARDLAGFLTVAHELELLVVLRPGPYICAEWEFGGFPYWLIKANASIPLRTSDRVYMNHVTNWFNELMPKMRPLLYSNGGPIISVQIENEYGSFPACDHVYTQSLLELVRKLLVDPVVYFTTDGASVGMIKCGFVKGALTTVDFGGGNAKQGYHVLNLWNASFIGPYVNSEYYIGWLDLWGTKHSQVSAHVSSKTLNDALAMKASMSMYMFHGGTNFGFTSGAPSDNPFKPVPTSYDYDAAISEAGDLTFKYSMLRDTIGKYKPLPRMSPPRNSTKSHYGNVNMTLQGPLHRCGPIISMLTGNPSYVAKYPMRAELMDTGYGYILYRHTFTTDVVQGKLSVPGVRDRGYVLVNDLHYGTLYRDGPTEITIEAKAGDTLSILVENMGRVGYGAGLLRGTKGVISNITIDNVITTNWSMFNFRFNISLLQKCSSQLHSQKLPTSMNRFVPSTYLGTLNLDGPVTDTFVRLDGWYKGHVEVNEFNIGRYWPVRGPQQTLYVPSALLKQGVNHISVTELEMSPCSSAHACRIVFTDIPQINSNVSSSDPPVLLRTHHG